MTHLITELMDQVIVIPRDENGCYFAYANNQKPIQKGDWNYSAVTVELNKLIKSFEQFKDFKETFYIQATITGLNTNETYLYVTGSEDIILDSKIADKIESDANFNEILENHYIMFNAMMNNDSSYIYDFSLEDIISVFQPRYLGFFALKLKSTGFIKKYREVYGSLRPLFYDDEEFEMCFKYLDENSEEMKFACDCFLKFPTDRILVQLKARIYEYFWRIKSSLDQKKLEKLSLPPEIVDKYICRLKCTEENFGQIHESIASGVKFTHKAAEDFVEFLKTTKNIGIIETIADEYPTYRSNLRKPNQIKTLDSVLMLNNQIQIIEYFGIEDLDQIKINWVIRNIHCIKLSDEDRHGILHCCLKIEELNQTKINWIVQNIHEGKFSDEDDCEIIDYFMKRDDWDHLRLIAEFRPVVVIGGLLHSKTLQLGKILCYTNIINPEKRARRIEINKKIVSAIIKNFEYLNGINSDLFINELKWVSKASCSQNINKEGIKDLQNYLRQDYAIKNL